MTHAFLHLLKGCGGLVKPAGRFELIVEPDLGLLMPYGTVLLSRRPARSVTHEPFAAGDMDRGLLARVVELPRGAGRPPFAVAVGTTHLESPEGAGARDNFKNRRSQCAAAIALLRKLDADGGAAAYVLLWNFNAARGADEDALVTPPFRDAWLELHSDELPEFTYDAHHNLNARVYQSQLDKVVFANGAGDDSGRQCAELAVARAELVGVLPAQPLGHTDPLTTAPPPPSPLLHASVHYGLLVELTLTGRRLDKVVQPDAVRPHSPAFQLVGNACGGLGHSCAATHSLVHKCEKQELGHWCGCMRFCNCSTFSTAVAPAFAQLLSSHADLTVPLFRQR